MESPNLLTILLTLLPVAGVVVPVLWRTVKKQRALRSELAELRQQARSSAGERSHADAAPVNAKREHVFLSYVREDDTFAEELRVHLTPVLRESNLSVWSPWTAPSQDWQTAFRDAVAT